MKFTTKNIFCLLTCIFANCATSQDRSRCNDEILNRLNELAWYHLPYAQIDIFKNFLTMIFGTLNSDAKEKLLELTKCGFEVRNEKREVMVIKSSNITGIKATMKDQNTIYLLMETTLQGNTTLRMLVERGHQVIQDFYFVASDTFKDSAQNEHAKTLTPIQKSNGTKFINIYKKKSKLWPPKHDTVNEIVRLFLQKIQEATENMREDAKEILTPYYQNEILKLPYRTVRGTSVGDYIQIIAEQNTLELYPNSNPSIMIKDLNQDYSIKYEWGFPTIEGLSGDDLTRYGLFKQFLQYYTEYRLFEDSNETQRIKNTISHATFTPQTSFVRVRREPSLDRFINEHISEIGDEIFVATIDKCPVSNENGCHIEKIIGINAQNQATTMYVVYPIYRRPYIIIDSESGCTMFDEVHISKGSLKKILNLFKSMLEIDEQGTEQLISNAKEHLLRSGQLNEGGWYEFRVCYNTSFGVYIKIINTENVWELYPANTSLRMGGEVEAISLNTRPTFVRSTR